MPLPASAACQPLPATAACHRPCRPVPLSLPADAASRCRLPVSATASAACLCHCQPVPPAYDFQPVSPSAIASQCSLPQPSRAACHSNATRYCHYQPMPTSATASQCCKPRQASAACHCQCRLLLPATARQCLRRLVPLASHCQPVRPRPPVSALWLSLSLSLWLSLRLSLLLSLLLSSWSLSLSWSWSLLSLLCGCRCCCRA